ncbi:hypothetical protein OCOL_001582 [Ordospora colligata]
MHESKSDKGERGEHSEQTWNEQNTDTKLKIKYRENMKKQIATNKRINQLIHELLVEIILPNKDDNNVLCNAVTNAYGNLITKLYGKEVRDYNSYDALLRDPNIVNKLSDAIECTKERLERELNELKKNQEKIRMMIEELNSIRNELQKKENDLNTWKMIGETGNIKDKIEIYIKEKVMMYAMFYYINKDNNPQSITVEGRNKIKYTDLVNEFLWRLASGVNVVQSILDLISCIDTKEVDESGNSTEKVQEIWDIINKRKKGSTLINFSRFENINKFIISLFENINKFINWLYSIWISLYWLSIEQSYIQRFMKCYEKYMDIGYESMNKNDENEEVFDEMCDVVKGLYRSQALKKLAMMNHILKQIPKNSKDKSSKIYKRKERITNVVDGISTMIKERMIKFGPGSGGKEEKNEEKRIRIYIENEINIKITEITELVKDMNFNHSDDVYEKLDRLMVEMEYESGKSLEVLINDVQVEKDKDKESVIRLKNDIKTICKVLNRMEYGQPYMDEAEELKNEELVNIDMVSIEKSMSSGILDIVNKELDLTRIGVEKLFDFLVSRIKEIPDSNNKEWNDFKKKATEVLSVIFADENGARHNKIKSKINEEGIKVDVEQIVNGFRCGWDRSETNKKLQQIFNEVYVYLSPCLEDKSQFNFVTNLLSYKGIINNAITLYTTEIHLGKINGEIASLNKRLKEIEKELKNGKYAMEIKDTEEIDTIYEKIDGDVNKLLNKFEKKYKEYEEDISKHKEKLVYTEDFERKVNKLIIEYSRKILDHLNGEVPDLRVKRDTSTGKDGEKQNNNVQGLIQIQHGNGCKCKDCDDVDGNETIAAVVVSTVIVCMMATLLSTYISYVGEVKMSKVVMRVMDGLCMIGSVGVGVYMIYRVYFEDAEEQKKIEKIEGIVKKNAKDVKMMWSEGMTMTAMIVCTVIMIPEMMMNSIVMDEEIVNVGNVMSVAMTMAVIVAVMYVAENSVDEREERSEGYLGSGGGVRVNDVLMMAGMFVMMTMRVMESVSGYIEGWDGRVIVMIAVGTAMMMVMNVILYGMSERYRRMMGRIVVKSEEEDVLYESGLRSGIVCVMVLLGTVPSMYERVRNMMNDWPSSEVGVA